jgi:phosphoribosylformimino-5-aminoimidazole carboxamide ribotide isomerase
VQVIPAVDVLDGQVVRLRAGDPEALVWRGGPAATAVAELAAHGAPLIHVVDLDGALRGTPTPGLIEELVLAAEGAGLQVGGGLRSIDSIDAVLARGAARAVVGTAMLAPRFARIAARRYGDRLVGAIDADDDSVAIRGWRTRVGGTRAAELAKQWAEAGVRRLSVTSVRRDGSLRGPDLDLVDGVVASVDIPVLAAGGISGMDDVRRLEDAGCEGAIVGLAIWTGRVALDQISFSEPRSPDVARGRDGS